MNNQGSINVKSDALLLINIQRDFFRGGALPVPESDGIIPLINRWLAVENLFAVAVRDWHPAGHVSFKGHGGLWPPHCVQGTPGADFHPDMNFDNVDFVVSKGKGPGMNSLSGFGSPDLLIVLKTHDVHRLWVAGLTTEDAIRATVMDALRKRFAVFVIADAIRGRDVASGNAATACNEMTDAGAVFVNSGQVLPSHSPTAS